MRTRAGRRPAGATRKRILTGLVAIGALVAGQAVARALDVDRTPTPVVGNTTWFSGLGAPYGGCGIPQDALDSQDFVALNVFNTPGDYEAYPRPLTGANAAKIGMWDNGRNCGRWVQVTVDDYCTGTNDGSPGQSFCRNGSWVADAYKGATLTMLVADSCGDANAWCRDDPYHLDLSHDSLNKFMLDGKAVGDLDPAHFNNRHMKWQFVAAPDYSGDITIAFMQGAQRYWGAVALSHLANGLHGVQYYAAGAWNDAPMNGDMGQSYVLKPLTEGGTQFRIRAKDAADTWINNGREYTFSLPASCADQCSAAYTQVDYTTTGPGGTPVPTTPVPTTPVPTTPVPTTPAPQTTTPQPPASPTCTVADETVSWQNGLLSTLTITNTGSSSINGWKLAFDLPAGQNIVQGLNATYTPSRGTVTGSNVSYNATISPGAAIQIGFVANHTGSAAKPTSFTLNGAACSVA